MLTRQEYVTRIIAAFSALTDKLVLLNLMTKKLRTALCFSPLCFLKIVSTKPFKHTLLLCSEILALSLAILSNAQADVRWYRYYDSRGTPTLSNAVSEQHLQHGYDVLDSRMQLIRHYRPFSADKYAQQQILREQAIMRRINDRHLQETYVSSDRATMQCDREISNIDGQIRRSEVESKHLSEALNGNITAAANFDRQNKSIPASLKTELEKNRSLLNQSNSNIAALKAKRELTSKQFNDAISQLKIIEVQGNKPDITTTP